MYLQILRQKLTMFFGYSWEIFIRVPIALNIKINCFWNSSYN